MIEFDLDPESALHRVRQGFPADADHVVRTRHRLALLPHAFPPHAAADPIALNVPFDPTELEWDLPGQTDMDPIAG